MVKLILLDLVVRKVCPFTQKKSTLLMLMDLWCLEIGGGNGIFSILLEVGLSIVMTLCSIGFNSPKICCAFVLLSMVTSELVMRLCLSM